MNRLEMVGEIRTMLPQLWDSGRYALAKEVMGEIHQDDFSCVEDGVVRKIWNDLCDATRRLPGEPVR